jgi:hypothetical protein
VRSRASTVVHYSLTVVLFGLQLKMISREFCFLKLTNFIIGPFATLCLDAGESRA